MELRRSDQEGLNRLGELWKATPGAEYEAMLTGVDLTAWQDVIQYLRSLGMRENPQIVKLNICLSNDIRFTLEGAGAIQAYCRDNKIAGKPFTAMLKEPIADAEPVTLGSYSVKAKLKRELPLAPDDARVKEAIANWDRIGKHFRNIQRFEFVAPGGVPLRFDVSLVRENAGRPARTFQEARVTGVAPRYEVEVELTAARDTTDGATATRHILRGISWLLQGRQRSFVLVSNPAADYVRESIGRIFGSVLPGGNRRVGSNRNRAGPQPQSFRYPGPQPATLERKHMGAQPEPGVPNLRSMAGGYNVTDKADGLRCALFVSDNGRIFLVDAGGRVYATGRETDKALAGTVLDGEWIRRDRTGKPVSHYYAFDILAARGDIGVASLPFLVAGAMIGSAAAQNTRQTAMSSAVATMTGAAQTVRGIPAAQNLQISTKTFRSVGEGAGASIFRDCAAVVLEDAKAAPYNTDGLIFTPNAVPLPLGRGTWSEQLKWKPAAENTIDFLVVVERERTKDGQPTAVEAVGTKYREDTGHTVRFKTLRLFVGSAKDAAFADPRTTVLDPAAPLPTSLEEGEWREVEFRPTDPRDPTASVCYVALGEGSGDPAGAAPAAVALDTDGDHVRARNGDIIQSNMIVEMAYFPERAAGWRWEPQRVRHDKTERWLAQQAQGGRKGGTMNADWVANSIWNTIHNPVSDKAVRTGEVEYCPAVPVLAVGRRAPTRDVLRVQCLRNFVDDWVKRRILYGKTVPAGGSVLDLAVGAGEDLNRWMAAGAGFVLGTTTVAANLNDPVDGAYRRVLDKIIALGGRDSVPPMTFAQADAVRRLSTGDAGFTAEDQGLLRTAFGGPAAGGFDVVMAPMTLGDACRDENTLAGFLTNLADAVKVGGYLVGYGLDGDAVARAVFRDSVAVGRDGAADVWTLQRRYGSAIGSSVPPSAAGLGLAVDADFIAAGKSSTEFLASWPYLLTRFAECGLDVLSPEECGSLGVPATTQMFAEAIAAAAAAGDVYEMTPAVRRWADMHRWFILKRRVDRRPAPPAAALAAPVVVEEAGAAAPVVAEAAAAPPQLDVIDLGEPPAEPAAEAPPAPFVVNPANKSPDLRLGEELKDWPRYMSLGSLVEISDLATPAIKYPSIEAAIASAKYQRATDKPDLGPQLFRVEGAIHQKREAERVKYRADGNEAALAKSMDDQVADVRVASGANKMKAYKATWNKEAWDAQKLDVYRDYLAQRYETDARFRSMIDAIKATGGEILFANGTEVNELGVGVRVDGSVVGGENKIGKLMMGLGA